MKRGTPEYWAQIRAFYRDCGARPDPYRLMQQDWPWSPIEREAWMTLRTAGVLALPEFPVGRRFADFAIPEHRIALEVDGAKWHDKSRDEKRDLELAAHGWATIRVPGRLCYAEFSLDEPEANPMGIEAVAFALSEVMTGCGPFGLHRASEILLSFTTAPGRLLMRGVIERMQATNRYEDAA